MDKFTDKALAFRMAEQKDVPLILEFIRDLADYEHMLDEVVATPELLEKWIFDERKAEVVFAVEEGRVSILRTCTCARSSEERGMGRRSSRNWRGKPRRAWMQSARIAIAELLATAAPVL